MTEDENIEEPLVENFTDQPLANQETQAADCKGNDASQNAQTHRAHEVPITTLVRLAGLPLAQDVKVIESKVDVLTAKLTNISIKVDRLSSQISKLANESDFERTEAQIADLRNLIKKALSSLVTLPNQGNASEVINVAPASKETPAPTAPKVPTTAETEQTAKQQKTQEPPWISSSR